MCLVNTDGGRFGYSYHERFGIIGPLGIVGPLGVICAPGDIATVSHFALVVGLLRVRLSGGGRGVGGLRGGFGGIDPIDRLRVGDGR